LIQVTELSKCFDGFSALSGLNVHVETGSIYGLIGVNGSGKTTLIKHLTGVYMPDAGQVTFDGEDIYENTVLKERLGYIPDDLYFFNSYSIRDMASFYRKIYPAWNEQRYRDMLREFGLPAVRKISKFSKGMQKQAAFILVMSTMPDYLILDEPIDGLDPLIRKRVWRYVVSDVAERQMTVLVSSHNLREMEGICDSIGILSEGRMMIERDLEELKTDIHKIQVAFKEEKERPLSNLNILHREKRGSVELLIVRNAGNLVKSELEKEDPAILDMLPLSLEEIFIYEMGGENSEIQSILF
jgi:ABC-2 type transport system ATP-binding protein